MDEISEGVERTLQPVEGKQLTSHIKADSEVLKMVVLCEGLCFGE